MREKNSRILPSLVTVYLNTSLQTTGSPIVIRMLFEIFLTTFVNGFLKLFKLLIYFQV